MDEPPTTVMCKGCGMKCGARIVTVKVFGKEVKRWEFTCSNSKCSLAWEDVQHKCKA